MEQSLGGYISLTSNAYMQISPKTDKLAWSLNVVWRPRSMAGMLDCSNDATTANIFLCGAANIVVEIHQVLLPVTLNASEDQFSLRTFLLQPNASGHL